MGFGRFTCNMKARIIDLIFFNGIEYKLFHVLFFPGFWNVHKLISEKGTEFFAVNIIEHEQMVIQNQVAWVICQDNSRLICKFYFLLMMTNGQIVFKLRRCKGKVEYRSSRFRLNNNLLRAIHLFGRILKIQFYNCIFHDFDYPSEPSFYIRPYLVV